ncbi:MAG TPA: hypothetical protein VF824_04990 [Thermoanaerobaculia bacterium]|jgi:hypothetical protein
MAQGFQLQLTNATNSDLVIGATPSGFTVSTNPPVNLPSATASSLMYFEVSGSANLLVNYSVLGQPAGTGGFVNLEFDSSNTNTLYGTIFMYEFAHATGADGASVYPYTLLFPINSSEQWPFLCLTFVPVVGATMRDGQGLPPAVPFR